MEVGVEISLYPLQEQPLPPIRALIERLNAHAELRVVTNSLSTQLFGEYQLIMRILTHELQEALAGLPRGVVLMKIVGPLDE